MDKGGAKVEGGTPAPRAVSQISTERVNCNAKPGKQC